MSSGPSPHRWDIAKYSRHRPDAGGPSPNAWQYVADKDIRLLFTEPNPLFPAVPSLRVVVHQGPKPITLESLVIIPSLSLNLQVSEDGLVFQYLCEQRTRKFQLRFVESGSVARVLAVLSKYITVPVDLPLELAASGSPDIPRKDPKSSRPSGNPSTSVGLPLQNQPSCITVPAQSTTQAARFLQRQVPGIVLPTPKPTPNDPVASSGIPAQNSGAINSLKSTFVAPAVTETDVADAAPSTVPDEYALSSVHSNSSHATSQSISASPQGPLTQTSDSGSTVLLPATDSGTVCDVGSAKRALMSLSDEQIISLVQSIRQDPAFKFVRERVKRLCRSIQ